MLSTFVSDQGHCLKRVLRAS